jgi:PAS domain S-box-containing protein
VGPVGELRAGFGGDGLSSVRTIFVVGASDQRRTRAVALLTLAGHHAVEIVSIDEALVRIAAETPPLVVFDFEPSDLAALAACQRIKADSPDTFILQIAEGFYDDPTATVALDSVIDAYLVEPIDPQELLALVRSLLRLQKVESDLRDSEDRLLLAQESAGLAILDWVITTNSFVHSDNLLDLFDLVPRAEGEPFSPTTLLERIHPEDLGALIGEFSTESQTARSFDKEFRIVRRDGSVRWIASRGRFFSGTTGIPERMVSLSFDVTERKTAERANAELASIVTSSIDAIVGVDGAAMVTSWNAGAERLFGHAAATMIGQSVAVCLSEMSADEREAHRHRLSQGEAHEFESRHTKPDGEVIDLWVTSAPMRASTGPVIGASLIFRDISPQKRREDHIRFLMRELTHRSKNLLAVIQAMARQSLTGGITPEEFVKRFTERLAGLAGSHDLLSSVDWKGASLMDLIRSQLNHYEDLFGTRIVLDGSDVFLRPEAAQNIGIALHELSTNAAKYGALSNDDGRVTIAWGVADATFEVSWRESGGPDVVAPTRKGFGTVVMDRIAGRALNGKSGISFEPAGVVWTLVVPAASAVAA